jgi:predicted Zn-dependent protease
MKNILTLILAITIANCISAQSIEQVKADLQNENYKAAKQSLLSINKTQPSAQSNLYLGNAYLKLDEMDSAKVFYLKAEAGTDAYAHIAKARMAIINNADKAVVKGFIEKAINISKKKDAEVFYQAGFLSYQPKAVAPQDYQVYFEQAALLSPNADFYKLALGDNLLDQHEGGKAMSKYEEVTDKNANNLMALIKIGRLFYSSMNYTKAIEFLERANAINANYDFVHKELGELYYLTRSYEKATAEFRKYLDLNNNDSRAKATYAGFLFQLKEYQKAVDEVSGFSKQDTTNYIYYRILAYSNCEIKKMKDAKVAMTNFWKYCKKSKLITLDYIYSGRIATGNADTANAINYFSKAVELDSNDAELQSEYAKVLFNAKRYKQSALAYKKRTEMKQKTASPLDFYYLGRSCYSSGDFINADSAFSKFVDLQPQSPDGYLWRAKSNVEQEDKTNLKGFAIVHYKKFIELTSADPSKHRANLISAYNYLAFVALTQLDNVTAKENFNKILEIDPNNAKALDELKRLK